MSEKFNPYHEWLGIPAGEQPPNHYRLLGIPAFEESPTVIENAADRQMAHLRTFQTGRHGAESQKLLNEVAAARVCLLHAAKRVAYDQWLHDTLQAQQPKTADQPGAPTAFEFLDQETPPRKTAPGQKTSKPRTGIYLAAAVGAALTLIAVLWVVFSPGGGGSGAANLATQPRTPEPAAPKVVEPAKPPPPPPPAPVVATTSPQDRSVGNALRGVPWAEENGRPPVASERHGDASERHGGRSLQRIASAPSDAESKPAPAGKVPLVAATASPPGAPKPAPENPSVKPEEPAAPTAAKQPVPDEAAIAKALEAARQSFRDDYERAKTPAEKVALAGKLRETAEHAAVAPAERFVLLRLARDMAIKAGDAKAAFAAIDAMQKAFSIDDLAMKSEALSAMSSKAVKPDDRKALADAALGLVQQAVEAENLDVAEEAMKTANVLAGKVRDRDLVQRVHAARKELAENVKAAGDVQAARATLKDKPGDPEANLALGEYLCFVRSQWPDGLKRLAAGSDEPLKTLAQRELKSTALSPEEAAQLGDAWWNLSWAAGGRIKEGMMLRAGAWYQQAEAGLPAGLVRVMVEKRLAEIEKLGREIGGLGAIPPLAVAPFNEKTAKMLQARWARHLRVPVEITNSIGMKLVLIPPGEFTIGSPDSDKDANAEEKPQHRVRVTKPFYLGKDPVTQEQWEAVMGNNPSQFKGPKNPVEEVSWDDCQQFCAKLNAKRGLGGGEFQLPTEAQWEYACRAGSTARYCFGDNEAGLGEYAWYGANSHGSTHPVGEKKPNAWGLYDMYGNVWEWCQDWYEEHYYANSPTDDATGPSVGSDRVHRGGGWGHPAGHCRSAYRQRFGPGGRFNDVGFRVCRVLAEK